MAWLIDDFQDLRMTGVPSKWTDGMFQLCRAVNERQGACAIPKTEWNTNGIVKSDLELTDLPGLRISEVGSGFCANMENIQSAITTMVTAGKFTIDSGISTLWTVAALETAIGTSLTDAPESPVDTRFWQAQKDALDLLIHCTLTATAQRHASFYGTVQASRKPPFVTDFGDENDIEIMWDKAVGKTPIDGLDLDGDVWWTMVQHYFTPLSSPDYRPQILDNIRNVAIVTGAVSGNLVATKINYTWNQANRGNLISPMGVDVAGVSVSSDGSFSVSKSESSAAPIGEFTFPGTSYLDINTSSTPTTCPFAPLTSAGETMSFNFKLNSVSFYFDIAHLLTDQIA